MYTGPTTNQAASVETPSAVHKSPDQSPAAGLKQGSVGLKTEPSSLKQGSVLQALSKAASPKLESTTKG